MSYRIYSYADPYKIDQTHFWDEIKGLPHLCSSQTLVEGLKKQYGRKFAPYIYTIDSVIELIYSEWINDVELQIKQFVHLSDKLDEMDIDVNLKKAMLFNKYELLESIRFLQEVGVQIDDLDAQNISREQKVLVELYKTLISRGSPEFVLHERVELPELRSALCQLLNTEVKKLEETLESKRRKEKELERDRKAPLQLKKLRRTIKVDSELINWLNSYLRPWSGELVAAECIEKIVVHGIHRFSPMIARFIHDLNKQGVEIIFLHNYEEKYPNIYKTWQIVYSWTDVKLIRDKNFRLYEPDPFQLQKIPLGQAIGDLLHSNFIPHDLSNVNFMEFDNNTSFANYVARLFDETKKIDPYNPNDVSYSIGDMSEQFYAANNEAVNELLKVYYPEHFGNRHFLAYPIGQMLLSLYEMWDDEIVSLRIKPHLLKECFNTNALQNWDGNLAEIYSRIELYYEDVETYRDYIDRTKSLISNLEKIEEDPDLIDLRVFSFFNCDIKEIVLFEHAITTLNSLARELFISSDGRRINFRRHFEKLMQKIKDKLARNSELDHRESYLLTELVTRFDSLDKLEIEGTMDDLKKSVHYYLKQKDNDESARWIVRNFEQIDGDVLLSGRKNTPVIYHFAGLSEKYMQVKVNDQLPWPLTEEFFRNAYNDESQLLNMVFTSYKEYKNFLRYALFYGIYYVKQPIHLSYVKHEEDKDEQPYFLLQLLGLGAVKFDEESADPYENVLGGMESTSYRPVKVKKVDKLDLQIFEFCPYRFALERLLAQRPAYKSEFLCDRYFIMLLQQTVWKELSGKNVSESELNESIIRNERRLKEFFPFWKPEVDFTDKRNKVFSELNKQISRGKLVLTDWDVSYLELKKEFIYASATEGDDGPNLLGGLHKMRSDRITSYGVKVKDDLEEYINSSELAKHKIGSWCGVCRQREVCLESYKKGGGYE